MIGYRSRGRILKALKNPATYKAAISMFQVYVHPVDAYKRYVFGSGVYPCLIGVKTPLGIVQIDVHTPDDMQTINEIFCRGDYSSGPENKRVIDIGANIGVSALYFLTRSPDVKCYLFEPLPANIVRLKENLKNFSDRYVLFENAVFNKSGKVEFNVEPTGRYCQLVDIMPDPNQKNAIEVDCLNINDILEDLIKKENRIDLIKIDIEGAEQTVIAAIDKKYFSNIKEIVYETNTDPPTGNFYPEKSGISL